MPKRAQTDGPSIVGFRNPGPMENEQVLPLADQVAVVTGGGRGIGAAIARSVGKLGATVVVCGRTRGPIDSVAQEIVAAGGGARAIVVDVTDLSSVQNMAAQVQRDLHRVDILVNNAGVGGFSALLHELDPGEWERILNTNLRGVYYCIRSFAPSMMQAGRGFIVNISSLAGKNALPKGAAYAASKWGLNGLSYSVAEELREHNIRVSVVCPGSVDTELSPHTGKDASKMLKPGDVAHVVEMLLTQSPNSFVSEVLLRPTQKP
jgi:3-oxoacyl-[acyl-carrier protein] reductase